MSNPSQVRFRLVSDRLSELGIFLESIRLHAPNVLLDLAQTVGSVFGRLKKIREKKDFIRPWFAPKLEIWHTFWNWVDMCHLSGGMDLDYLKSEEGLEFAEWHFRRGHGRTGMPVMRFPDKYSTKFDIESSPELIWV